MLSLQNGPKKKKQLKQLAAPRSHHVRQCARCGFEAKKNKKTKLEWSLRTGRTGLAISAYWEIVYFGNFFLEKPNSILNFGLLFSTIKTMYNFHKKRIWLNFGLFFHKLIWSPCLRTRYLRENNVERKCDRRQQLKTVSGGILMSVVRTKSLFENYWFEQKQSTDKHLFMSSSSTLA
jgi:hypothetical protein